MTPRRPTISSRTTWIADEDWKIDYFLPEHPELKCASYVWLSDSVGWPEGRRAREFLCADYNAEMLEQIARYPRVRNRSLFIVDAWGRTCRSSATGRASTSTSAATSRGQ